MIVILSLVIIVLLITVIIELAYNHSLRIMMIAMGKWIKDNSEQPLYTVWDQLICDAAEQSKKSDLDSTQQFLRKQLSGIWRAL